MADEITLHGWSAVARDPKAVLEGKAFLHEPQALSANEIAFPSDDPLVARIQAHARTHLPEPTYNHSMRVFYYGTAILRQQFPERAALSASTYALACLLHDVGTAPAAMRATRLSFEFDGGVTALRLLLGAGDGQPTATVAQAESVAEAIMRHQDLGDAGRISFLGQLLQLATVYDNATPNPHLVHRTTLASVAALFPRGKWCDCFADTVAEEIRLKPWAHSTALGDAFPGAVRGNKVMREFEP